MISKAQSTLLASVLVCAATVGCGSDGVVPPRLGTLSHGSDSPAECEPCWTAFKACFEGGQPAEECEQQIIDCATNCSMPPPPVECEHCAVGYDACIDFADPTGEDVAQDCAAGIDGCLMSCAGTGECEDAAMTDCVPWKDCEELRKKIEDCDPRVPPTDPAPDPTTDPENGDVETWQECFDLQKQYDEMCPPVPAPVPPQDLCEDCCKCAAGEVPLALPCDELDRNICEQECGC